MTRGVLWVILYVVLAISPLLLIAVFNPQTEWEFWYEVGKCFALVGFLIILLQPILAGRFRSVERPFGFDILIRYHKQVAVFGMLLLFAHPFLLAAGGNKWHLVTSYDLPITIWIGRLALALLGTNIIISLFRIPDRLKFERWRLLHNILAPAIFIFAFTHSFFTGDDLGIGALQVLWVGLLVLALVAFVYHRYLRPMMLGRHPYRVVGVNQETKGVFTINLAPPEGQPHFDFLPGQFQFITFHRRKHLPEEEHHWTISSSPKEKGYVSSTIKELGDFTSTIGETRAGDRATVHAPFGRFSYLFHPEEKELVFIAGGIGITPLMSALRYMRDNRDSIPVTLLYANNREEEITFRSEIEQIEKGEYPRLKVFHVLSKPGENWNGENGYIDSEKIVRLSGEVTAQKGYYLCGPSGLIDAMIKNLHDLGVSDKRIHIEIFSFLS